MKYLGEISDTKDMVNKGYVDQALSSKQDTLISGTNIKTINGESVVGNGNLAVSGGGGAYFFNSSGHLCIDYDRIEVES